MFEPSSSLVILWGVVSGYLFAEIGRGWVLGLVDIFVHLALSSLWSVCTDGNLSLNGLWLVAMFFFNCMQFSYNPAGCCSPFGHLLHHSRYLYTSYVLDPCSQLGVLFHKIWSRGVPGAVMFYIYPGYIACIIGDCNVGMALSPRVV